MAYTPDNNPYIPGDPYSYDLKWQVNNIKHLQTRFAELDENIQEATNQADRAEQEADRAAGRADFATEEADRATAEVLKAEGHATGTQEGTPVESDSPYYHNNSKYYSEQAASSAEEAGNYAEHIADPVAGLVANWLEENITQPTTPAVDASLTVAGAAADAATVGEQFKFNATNLYKYIAAATVPSTETTASGLTVTPNNDGSFNISGTATETALPCNFYIKPTIIPDFLQAGKTYTFMLESDSPGNYDLRLFSYISGSASLIAQVPPNVPTIVTIPANTAGMTMPLRVPQNVSVNGKVRLIINDGTFTNQFLTNIARPKTADFSLFKSVGVCGDSFATGWFYKSVAGVLTRFINKDHSWPIILGRKHGCTIGHFCYGGLDTSTYQTDTNGLPLLLNSDPCEAYILALGINDVARRGLEGLGTIADITNDYTQNPHTFFGDYARIIEQIMSYAPNSKLLMLTMAHNSGNYPAFNTAIEEIAAHYNIGLMRELDHRYFASKPLFENKWVNGHPTSIQASAMADAINDLFTNACNDNYTYFADLC